MISLLGPGLAGSGGTTQKTAKSAGSEVSGRLKNYLTVTLITCWPEITNSAGDNSRSNTCDNIIGV